MEIDFRFFNICIDSCGQEFSDACIQKCQLQLTDHHIHAIIIYVTGFVKRGLVHASDLVSL